MSIEGSKGVPFETSLTVNIPRIFITSNGVLTHLPSMGDLIKAINKYQLKNRCSNRDINQAKITIQNIFTSNFVGVCEFRSQLCEFAPGILRVTAESFNMSNGEFLKALSNGISVEEFTVNLTTRLRDS